MIECQHVYYSQSVLPSRHHHLSLTSRHNPSRSSLSVNLNPEAHIWGKTKASLKSPVLPPPHHHHHHNEQEQRHIPLRSYIVCLFLLSIPSSLTLCCPGLGWVFVEKLAIAGCLDSRVMDMHEDMDMDGATSTSLCGHEHTNTDVINVLDHSWCNLVLYRWVAGIQWSIEGVAVLKVCNSTLSQPSYSSNAISKHGI